MPASRAARAARPGAVRAGLLRRPPRPGARGPGRGGRSTPTPRRCAWRARAGKTRVVPAGEPAWRALERYLERGRPALAGTGERERALFLSKSGRRLSTSDVRRRLGLQTRRAGAPGRRLAAHAATLVRHASAGGGGGPADHPGAARARLGQHDPDLHSGRVEAPQVGVLARPPTRLTGKTAWRRTSRRSS